MLSTVLDDIVHIWKSNLTDILLVITYWQMFVKWFVNPGLGDGVANGGRPGHLSWDGPTDGVRDLTGSLDGPNLTCQMGWPPIRGSARAAYPAPQKASASGSASASPLAIRWLARPTPYPRAWTLRQHQPTSSNTGNNRSVSYNVGWVGIVDRGLGADLLSDVLELLNIGCDLLMGSSILL